MSRSPKILFFDCETSPNIVTSWGIGKTYLTADNIIKERQIICICYKWADNDKIHSLTWDKDQNDLTMVEKFREVYADADMVVGQNVKAFDLPWIRTRLVYHGLKPLPKCRVLDTYRDIRTEFYFNSNRLDYVAKYLQGEGKRAAPFQLWKDVVLSNSKKALKEMVEYCRQDVKELELFYYKIGPHLPTKFNLSVFYNDPTICPYCSSENFAKKGFLYTTAGARQRYLCAECGHSFTDGRSRVEQSADLKR